MDCLYHGSEKLLCSSCFDEQFDWDRNLCFEEVVVDVRKNDNENSLRLLTTDFSNSYPCLAIDHIERKSEAWLVEA